MQRTVLSQAHATGGSKGGQNRRDDAGEDLQRPLKYFLLIHNVIYDLLISFSRYAL